MFKRFPAETYPGGWYSNSSTSWKESYKASSSFYGPWDIHTSWHPSSSWLPLTLTKSFSIHSTSSLATVTLHPIGNLSFQNYKVRSNKGRAPLLANFSPPPCQWGHQGQRSPESFWFGWVTSMYTAFLSTVWLHTEVHFLTQMGWGREAAKLWSTLFKTLPWPLFEQIINLQKKQLTDGFRLCLTDWGQKQSSWIY